MDRQKLHIFLRKSGILSAVIAVALLSVILPGIATDYTQSAFIKNQPAITKNVDAVSTSKEYETNKPNGLNAKYAALIDGISGRVLFEKEGYTPAANASTTKIMTLLIALEFGNPEQLTTVSRYAASMPDVQLGIRSGEHYQLKDLMYSLMLQSHNDSAAVIAENVALSYLKELRVKESPLLSKPEYQLSSFALEEDFSAIDLSSVSVEQSKDLIHIFSLLMNQKAVEIGCANTYFITPNGLDAQDEQGKHSTTAVDLARIMAYCIKNDEFLKITQTKTYSFSSREIDAKGNIGGGNRSFNVHNTNAFLQMMDGVISGKTGFTNDAGYCYVCALKRDDKIFISVVLACGWPNNKTYKWVDTRKIMNFGIENYFTKSIFTSIPDFRDVKVSNGIIPEIKTSINSDLTTLIADFDNVNIVYSLPEVIEAPVTANSTVGTAFVYINDQLYSEIPIIARTSSDKLDFRYCFHKIIEHFLP